VGARISNLGILEARVSDLSVGGLALHCGRQLDIESEVSLVLPLPGSQGSVRVTGKVVNGNAAGRAGVRFSCVPEEDLNLLESWLATELAKLESAEMPLGESNSASPENGSGVLPSSVGKIRLS
jgi:hypothetical protein